MSNVNEVVRKNFSKVAEWIKTSFPHAIERSHECCIKCGSKHHVYHTSYITIYQGEIYYNRGSHGNGGSGDTYSEKDGKWITAYQCDGSLEEFMHEWKEQKHYIIATLQPYEDMYNFTV